MLNTLQQINWGRIAAIAQIVLSVIACLGYAAKDDVRKAILEYEDSQKKNARQELEGKPRCPECTALLSLLPVNDSPSTQTNDDSKCVWLCRACLYERFSTNTIEEELKWLEQE